VTDDAAALQKARVAWQACIERRDVEGAASLLHRDYALILVIPERAIIPRERWLQVLPDYEVERHEVVDEVVDIVDDLAVVLQRVEMTATVLGEDRTGGFVITDVWRREASAWLVWRRHSTPMRAGSLPGG
jgi:ketosteroid isomerase-like protein